MRSSSKWQHRVGAALVCLTFVAALSLVAVAAGGGSDGVVSAVVKAPVTSDGDVAGHPTDLVLDFDTSLDPRVAGRAFDMGGTIKITFPAGFTHDSKPFDFIGGPSMVCGLPLAMTCNTVALLEGWPQHPYAPFSRYTPTFDDTTNTLTITINDPAGLTSTACSLDPNNTGTCFPGVKSVHLILSGFTNPKPGKYQLGVELKTSPGAPAETGTGDVQIIPEIRPSIHVTSVQGPPPVGLPLRIDPLYQAAATDANLALPWDLLLWDRNGDPITGATIQQSNANHYGIISGSGSMIGQVKIDAPAGATGQNITAVAPSALFGNPVFGALVPTARLQAQFHTGSATGTYTTTFSINGGNSVTFVVDVS